MSIIEEARADMVAKAVAQPSADGVEKFVDPATLTLIIDAVMKLASMLCTGATSMQTAQAMKSPSPIQRWQHKKNCDRKAEEFVTSESLDEVEQELDEGREDDEDRREWKDRKRTLLRERRKLKRDLELSRDEYARKAYYGMKQSAAEQPVEKIAETVEAYRLLEEFSV